MKIFSGILFFLMCLSQWYVPVSMIAEQEDIRKNGQVFLFKTAPVDPTDPFRGKYITLDFEAETFKDPNRGKWKSNQQVYVVLQENKSGFAMVESISETVPVAGSDYFEAQVRFSNEEGTSLRFPFERFYLEESKSSEAERIYSESNRNEDNGPVTTAFAVVRIKNGKTSLEDVKVNDRSIVEIIREMKAAKE